MEKTITTPIQSAVKVIIDQYKTPAAFIDIFSSLADKIHDHMVSNEDKKLADPHYLITSLLTDLGVPWFKQGKNVLEEMGNGMEKIADIWDRDHIVEQIGTIVIALSDHWRYKRAKKDLKNDLMIISSLTEIAEYVKIHNASSDN